jgi:origin recognition complex subunit 5
MLTLDAVTANLIADHPAHTAYIDHLTTLVVVAPQPFLLINERDSPRLAAYIARRVLHSIQHNSPSDYPPLRFAALDAVACVHPRIVYDTILNALGEGVSAWEDGSMNWPYSDDAAVRWNDSFDGFLAGLRAISAKYRSKRASEPPRLVVLIENAERLKDNVSAIFQPLTNLQELVRFLQCIEHVS